MISRHECVFLWSINQSPPLLAWYWWIYYDIVVIKWVNGMQRMVLTVHSLSVCLYRAACDEMRDNQSRFCILGNLWVFSSLEVFTVGPGYTENWRQQKTFFYWENITFHTKVFISLLCRNFSDFSFLYGNHLNIVSASKLNLIVSIVKRSLKSRFNYNWLLLRDRSSSRVANSELNLIRNKIKWRIAGEEREKAPRVLHELR